MNQRIPVAPIPQFALYGETAFAHEPEFVHIEDLRERSARNGWIIKPHRHPHLFQILCMFSGEAQVRLDERCSTHNGAWVVTMPAGVVHGFHFRPDTRGVVLSLGIKLLGLDAENHIGPMLKGSLARPCIVNLQQQSPLTSALLGYLERIQDELKVPREDQQLALYSLIKLVLVTLQRRKQEERFAEVEPSGIVQLESRFRALLEQHYKEHWLICDYADALHVSVSTLNRACQEVLGRSAKKLIQERLHIEAKRRLLYTRETLDQISYGLGFKDAAYFSRVFKQLEGIPPKRFRQHAAQA